MISCRQTITWWRKQNSKSYQLVLDVRNTEILLSTFVILYHDNPDAQVLQVCNKKRTMMGPCKLCSEFGPRRNIKKNYLNYTYMYITICVPFIYRKKNVLKNKVEVESLLLKKKDHF